MTFQMVDDLLDLQINSEDTGKNPLQDLNEGKLTWPLIIACERSPSVREKVIAYANSTTSMTLDEIRGLLDEIRETGAIEETRQEAGRYAQMAIAAINQLPQGDSSNALSTVVDTALHRRK